MIRQIIFRFQYWMMLLIGLGGSVYFGWLAQPVMASLSQTVSLRPLVLATKPTFATVDLQLSTDQHQLSVALGKMTGYNQAAYILTFQNDAAVEVAMTGVIPITTASQSSTIELGACSSQLCTYALHPHLFKLHLILTGSAVNQATLGGEL